MFNLKEIKKNLNINLVSSWFCCDYGYSWGYSDMCNCYIWLVDILNFGDIGCVLYIC